MVRYCVPFFVIPGSFIEQTTWDALALAAGLMSSSELLENWLITYHMYRDVIEVPDEPPLYIVRFETMFWLQMSAFFASGAADEVIQCYLRPDYA